MSVRPLLISLVSLVLVTATGLGCGDPLAAFAKAIEDGKKAAIAEARSDAGGGLTFEDDEDAKRRAGGVSISGRATRLYYQFIDERGQVAFVDRLEDVPNDWRGRVGFVEMSSPPPLSPAMARNTRRRQTAGSGSATGTQRVAARMPGKVVLYSAEWCGACKMAKRHLDDMGINYEVVDVDEGDNLDELVAKTGQRGIPVLDVGGRIVNGFSPDEYDELIRSTRT